MTNNDPRNQTEPTPISDPDAPKQHPHDDHKVAENPPADERDDPRYQSEESGE
ncbi:hypothetical protein [Corynebacterium sp.]|uniref:hypothetical protein n=1 Tax=Corynebacterium sp. TaxID=1720 RepID=UPI0019C72EE5|nr:hypothetical protein [Corynebacterium sp.]HHU67797.1 hypothetical protein [Corynebacterium sp.]